jgi:hypothetical protein
MRGFEELSLEPPIGAGGAPATPTSGSRLNREQGDGTVCVTVS